MDGAKVYLERGRPIKAGEMKVSFVLYQPLQPLDGQVPAYLKEDRVLPLFDAVLPEETPLRELRQMLAEKINADAKLTAELGAVEPARLRLRDLGWNNRYPARAYADNATLKDTNPYASYYSTPKTLAVQPLQAPETVAAKDDVVLLIQQWFPSRFELSGKGEIVIRDSTTVAEFKQMLHQRFGINSVGLARPSYSWTPPDVLEASELDYDRIKMPDEAILRMTGSPFYARDGELYVFCDRDEKLKELTPEEKTKFKRMVAAQKNKYYGKEKALHIET